MSESALSKRYQITPTLSPEVSILYRFERRHRVHLETRIGGAPMVAEHSTVRMVEEVLRDVDRFNDQYGPRVQLFLRGFWHDNSSGSLMLSLQLQHDRRSEAAALERLSEHILEAFGHHDVKYGGQGGRVVLKLRQVDFEGDHYASTSSDDYADLF